MYSHGGPTFLVIHVFSESCISLCSTGQFVISLDPAARRGGPVGTLAEVEEGEGRDQDMEDGDATGLGKVRWKVQVVGR